MTYASGKLSRGNRLGAIEHEILDELSFGDLLVGFLCSARSTRRMYKIARERAMRRYRTRQAVDRLVSEGYVKRRGDNLSITSRGRVLLRKAVMDTRALLQNKQWDGKWRIITFDIPENMRRSRDEIRLLLKRAGFIKLQHSTWIFPHECEELSLLIKNNSRLSNHILYGVLEKIQDDARLRNAFSLA